jgi:prephenate dehydratase
MSNLISFQGVPGAYSDLACRNAYPEMQTLPCASFEAAIDAVRDGRAALGMLPVENSLAGRVSDIHHLLPQSGLFIVAEQFQRVEHCLLGIKGGTIADLKRAHSHSVALGQVRRILADLHLTPVVEADTAGAAQLVAQWNRKEDAAIASSLAAEIYGLTVLRENVEDAAHNTTRFYVVAPKPVTQDPKTPGLMTTFVFRVRNVPAALYKALGGFATNSVNMTKLESYMIEGNFFATMFYADVEGHPDDRGLAFALEELKFFSRELTILGVYPAHPFRATFKEKKA